jgi:uncharacterized membrane protein YczE
LDSFVVRRVVQLFVGLTLYGAGAGLTVAAGLGVDPWTVLAEGLATRTGIGVGWITNFLGAAILLLWIPLRQLPGVGTVANIAVVGTSMQVVLELMPPLGVGAPRVIALAAGILLVAVASGLYLGARFGPGPRDGLMTGLHTRLGAPIWACRLAVEGSVLVLGWMLGGTVGVGTVVFAVCIGPLVHLTLPIFATAAPDAAHGLPALSALGIPGGPRRA